MPVQIVDGTGNVLADSRISFLSPQVDNTTQTVLVKARIANNEDRLRNLQFIRARVIWGMRQGPVVPVLAVSRIGGQYFVFVAEDQNGKLVAHQKPLRVGEMVGNDYVVLEGIKPGDKVIVSGTQFLVDGAPVMPKASFDFEFPEFSPGTERNWKPRARSFVCLLISSFADRYFATVCALLIILAGAAVIPTLPVSQFPDLAPPQVSVSSGYTGASAQTVESAVTIPLEQQINGAQGMKYLTSTSANDGTSSITATFDLDRDPDLAAVDVQNRVNTALGRLPAAVKTTGVTVAKSSQNFVLGAAVYSPDGRYTPLFMSNYLDVYVRDTLKRVPGVAEVFVFGERKYSMRLWLDPERMASRALTATDVVNALQEQNVEVAAGQVGQPPIKTGQQFQISVRAVGRLSEPCSSKTSS